MADVPGSVGSTRGTQAGRAAAIAAATGAAEQPPSASLDG